MITTGSKVEAALRCPPSTVYPQVENHHAAADLGTWKHSFLAELKNGREWEEAIQLVPVDLREAVESADLRPIIEGTRGLVSEVSYAYDVQTGRGRFLGTGLSRDYKVEAMEIPMTIDFAGELVIREVAGLVVGDLKTGWLEVTPAKDNWQLKLAALAVQPGDYPTEEVTAFIVHAKGGLRPFWDVTTFSPFDLALAQETLRRLPARIDEAAKAIGVGQRPRLHTGIWCQRCPARLACPTTSELVKRMAGDPEEVVRDIRNLMTPETAARAWARLKVVKKLIKEIEAAVHAQASHEPIPIGDGVVLGPVLVERTELKGAVVRDVLEKKYGRAVALQAVEEASSKAAVERAVKPVALEKKAKWVKGMGPTPTIKAEVEAVLKEVESAGGFEVADRVEVKEHTLTADEMLAKLVGEVERKHGNHDEGGEQ